MPAIGQSNLELQRRSQDHADSLVAYERWRAVTARDGRYNGAFVFGVRSTGVYCRPSCPARRPRREQVVFFSGPVEAEQSGFRPCKRCRPRDNGPPPQVELIDRLCRYIDDNLNGKLTLSNLSAYSGISSHHLQRTFKRVVGISPRQYVEARRLAKMKRSLRSGETVTRALYKAGFSSRSRLYEKSASRFGTSPGTFRRGGIGLRIEYAIVGCSLGRLLIGATEHGLCAVCMGDSDAAVEAGLSEDYPSANIHRNDEGMLKWITKFMKYFAGQHRSLNLPLDVQATAFQWRVWKEIQSIPYGSTATYGRIASALNAPQAARAVASACAKNPLSLVIPCHRVIGEDGGLHGYRWGIKRKRALLLFEQTAHHKANDS